MKNNNTKVQPGFTIKSIIANKQYFVRVMEPPNTLLSENNSGKSGKSISRNVVAKSDIHLNLWDEENERKLS